MALLLANATRRWPRWLPCATWTAFWTRTRSTFREASSSARPWRRCCCATPRLLLLDEPTKGIDSFFKRELARIFDRLKERGVTIAMVSHDVEFCARNADSVSMFFDGSVVTSGTPRRFFSQNSFYTTAANRMSRNVFADAVTDEDVVELCLS